MQSINKQQVQDLLCELIRIPSINPNLSSDGESNEMYIATFVRDWLIAHKIHARIEEVQPNRPNVYAEIGEGNGETLCFCAHFS